MDVQHAEQQIETESHPPADPAVPQTTPKDMQGTTLPSRIERRGRSLIAWMKFEEATRVLVGGRMDKAIDLEIARRVQQARDALASRTDSDGYDGLIEEPPPELAHYIERLHQYQAAVHYFNEGWTIKVADLTRVIAFQPSIAVDRAEERAGRAQANDIVSIAAVTLPIDPPEMGQAAAFNQAQNCWVFASPNPNLQVLGNCAPSAPAAVPAFGFVVGVLPSFMQVGRYNGRYYLRDGYHRAYGLLRRGIKNVPTFVRDFDAIQDLGALRPGMLPQEAFLGNKPPMLRDLLDDLVAADIRLPVTQKVILVQATEVVTIV